MSMTGIKQRLFDAFRKDHAVLGRGLHDLSTRLAGGDSAAAKELAARVNLESGAHIGFEEHDFYPALEAFLSADEIEKMFAEHAEGARIIAEILALDTAAPLSESKRDELLAGIRRMQQHVSECGELFGALGGLDEKEMERLLNSLEAWRRKAPAWLDIAQQGPGTVTA